LAVEVSGLDQVLKDQGVLLKSGTLSGGVRAA